MAAIVCAKYISETQKANSRLLGNHTYVAPSVVLGPIAAAAVTIRPIRTNSGGAFAACTSVVMYTCVGPSKAPVHGIMYPITVSTFYIAQIEQSVGPQRST